MTIQQFQCFSLTFANATAHNLYDLVNAAYTLPDLAYHALEFQANSANQGVIWFNSSSTVDEDHRGVRLEAPTSGIPDAPWSPTNGFARGDAIRLSSFYVKGSSGDKLHISATFDGKSLQFV